MDLQRQELRRATRLEKIESPLMYDPILHVVLYEPEIPFNTGSVGRTCVAVGAKLWLVRPLGFQIEDRRLKRAGLDYWQYLVWEIVDNYPMLLDRLGPRPMWFFSKRAGRLYTEAAFQPGDALVFGSETQGLPLSLLKDHSDRALCIPIRSQVRSLNLTVSVGVVVYEALRQFRGLNPQQ